ncbi:hypothetical protein VVD49_03055 [Uliginosibacterium sp. H3]|uniref:Pectate lyase domain-containing protein n=1 Tax=Uliginosibacterium silvisoli TaxID=3114758 RepID=A0ABU6JYW3_9RHOO|nr:hypothetical protein [Uliginosibacterium sp. H3]
MKLRFLVPLLAAAFAGGAHAATDYPNNYTKCAQVGSVCNLSGTANVAFGKSGAFTYAILTGPFTCAPALFPGTTLTSGWCSLPTGTASSSSSSSVASSSSSSSVTSGSSSSAASSSAASATGGGSASSWAGSSATATDARAQTGASTPLPDARYGTRTLSAPVLVDGKHSPSNYRAAPVLPTWQFATVDPTAGQLTFERAAAPTSNGWHTWSRKGKVIVTGGAAAATNRVYTVFNGQQLVAALKEAGNEPKIVRVIGHIDLRWSANNTVFQEYTSYEDQKYGGSISIPSNTTLVGVNDAQGRAARITGTTVLIGQEWATTGAILTAACGTTKASVDAESDYKTWVGCGKDPEDYPTWTRNIIIRNLQIDAPWDVNPEDSANAYADAMTVSRAQNIFIDHLSMSDGDTPDSLDTSITRHDGLLDVVRGADYVTITNSYFNKHHKTTLIGNGDSGRAWSDEGRLHVTLSNNFWDRMGSRLPLNRFGQVHMFNNYIYGLTDGSAPADFKFDGGPDPRYRSNMILENMYFEITQLATDSWCGKAILDGKQFIGFRSAGHLMLSNKGGNTVAQGWDGQCSRATPSGADVWYPPYAYTTKATVNVPAFVKANAGAGKIK